MKYLAVKNWEHYQHYTDRRPPWIKLHNSLLDDYGFTTLSTHARYTLITIWILASRHENRIPNDIRYIARAISAERLNLKSLIDAGFLYETDEGPETIPAKQRKRAARPVLASHKQSAMSEVETETETERTTPKPPVATDVAPARGARKPPTPSPEVAAVLAHYVETHPRRRPGPKEAKAVERALGFGYSVDDLKAAITGNATDDWHKERKKHELAYVLRDNGKIDDFIARGESADTGPLVDEWGLLTPRGMKVAGLVS